MDEEFKCCFCREVVKGWGNDPWPVRYEEDCRCCDDCNRSIILPARLKRMLERRTNG